MRYTFPPQSLYISNRSKFVKQMMPGSVAVFNSNDIYPSSSDGHLKFRQHSDILYLSGMDQEESILVLFPDAYEPEFREMLFLKETSPQIAIWEGAKFTKEQATTISGVANVYWLQEFDVIFNKVMAQASTIYLNTNEHLRAHVDTQTREDRFIERVKKQYPAHAVAKSAPILHSIRSVKEAAELELMQTACNITEAGIRRLLGFVKPGVFEYEIEAELIHEFVRRGSRGFAYDPIIASGANSNVLHYIANDQICKAGDLLLLDVGAEYANYASDLTRTIPVSGRYTPRQKQVYNAVLRVKQAATKLLVPGTHLNDYHKAVGALMEKELVDLGLITPAEIAGQDPKWPAYKKYFMHGTSHYLGLDVHDVGHWTKPIQAHMVFTVEPGIYIPEEGFGIRLEDNVVVQEKGDPFNLMRNIPLHPEEIEDLMNA